ncbi:MAG TPA: hypothetical protein PKE40_14800 [Arachnia sp.]|nr:hypothetical protein [Arachnia sp.]HMT87612.1 hypothetical protein [Arachnia sp.]
MTDPELRGVLTRYARWHVVGRNTAMLHLASTTPPAIFAGLIGIHIIIATRWAELSGTPWNSYAALRR